MKKKQIRKEDKKNILFLSQFLTLKNFHEPRLLVLDVIAVCSGHACCI